MSNPDTGRYAQISVKIWYDKKFRELSNDAKLVYLYVIINPLSTNIGAMPATIEGMSASLGMDYTEFLSGINDAINSGMLEFSDADMVLVIPNHFKHSPPGHANVVVSMIRKTIELPDSPLVDKQIMRLIDFMRSKPSIYNESFFVPFQTLEHLLTEPVKAHLNTPYRPHTDPVPTPSDPHTPPRPDTGTYSGNQNHNHNAGSGNQHKTHATTTLPIPLGDLSILKKLPDNPNVQAAQGFHSLSDMEILTWVVMLESEYTAARNKLGKFKKLAKGWATRLDPIWTTEHGRADLMDWLAHIWNSLNANGSKGVGDLDNESQWLNSKVSDWLSTQKDEKPTS